VHIFATRSECTTKSGTSAGSCASGYGVCCTCTYICKYVVKLKLLVTFYLNLKYIYSFVFASFDGPSYHTILFYLPSCHWVWTQLVSKLHLHRIIWSHGWQLQDVSLQVQCQHLSGNSWISSLGKFLICFDSWDAKVAQNYLTFCFTFCAYDILYIWHLVHMTSCTYGIFVHDIFVHMTFCTYDIFLTFWRCFTFFKIWVYPRFPVKITELPWQLRLDFISFVITGPSTRSLSQPSVKILNGEQNAGATTLGIELNSIDMSILLIDYYAICLKAVPM
jgi:hypothetical protein